MNNHSVMKFRHDASFVRKKHKKANTSFNMPQVKKLGDQLLKASMNNSLHPKAVHRSSSKIHKKVSRKASKVQIMRGHKELDEIKRKSIIRKSSVLPKPVVRILDLNKSKASNSSGQRLDEPMTTKNQSKFSLFQRSLAKESSGSSKESNEETKHEVTLKRKTEHEITEESSSMSKTESGSEYFNIEKSSLNKEDEDTNKSGTIKSSLKLKTGLVDSPFISQTQNTLLKLCRKTKVKVLKTQMKKHVNNLIQLGTYKRD